MCDTEAHLQVRLLVRSQHESVMPFSEKSVPSEKTNLFSQNPGIPWPWQVEQNISLQLVGLSCSVSMPSDHMQLLLTSASLMEVEHL